MARPLARTDGLLVGDFAVSSGWLAKLRHLWATPSSRPRPDGSRCTSGCSRPTGPPRTPASGRHSGWLDASATRTSEVVSLAYLEANLVYADRTEEAMRLQALAAVAGGEVDDFSVLELFSACERAHDVARAAQWDPRREGDRHAPEPPCRVGALPHPLRRDPDHGRTVAGSGRDPDRGRSALGARPTSASARSLSRKPSSSWSGWRTTRRRRGRSPPST